MVRRGAFPDWWLVVAACREPHFWPQQQGACIIDTGVHPADDSKDLGAFSRPGIQDAEGHRKPRHWSPLRVFSLNVQTLETNRSEEEGSDFPGRIQFLREQFCDKGAHIVCAFRRPDLSGLSVCCPAVSSASALAETLRANLA